MPRQHVYGKRAKKTPLCETWSSPDAEKACQTKPVKESPKMKDGLQKIIKTNNDVVHSIEVVEKGLEKLKLHTSERPPTQPMSRKILGAKDVNTARRREQEHSQQKTQLEKFSMELVDSETPRPNAHVTQDRMANLTPESLPDPRNPAGNTCGSGYKNPEIVDFAISEDEKNDTLFSHVRPLLDMCTALESRRWPTSFAKWSEQLAQHFDLIKIAEASYSEVYRLSFRRRGEQTKFNRSMESVLKIIAIKSPPKSTAQPEPVACTRTKRNKTQALTQQAVQKQREAKESFMSSVENIQTEVKLLQRLTSIPGFTNFRDLRIVQGRPPSAFVSAWKTYNKARARRDKSEFPDPSKKSSYREDQLWAVIEMQDAGMDLEKLMEGEKDAKGNMTGNEAGVRSVWEIWDVFWGVVLAVGKGEEAAKFEHRDLHLGNICIRCRPGDNISAPKIRPGGRKLGFSGLETTIIDYTLSRAELTDAVARFYPSPPSSAVSLIGSDPSSPASAQTTPEIAFLDLSKEAVFDSDADVDYQYEIYRYMRSCALYNDPLHEYTASKPHLESDAWRNYHPLTNLIWLHFILDKLLETCEWPSAGFSMDRVESEKDEAKVKRKALKLEGILKDVQTLLAPEELRKGDLESVTNLIGVAMLNKWLGEKDVWEWIPGAET